MDRIRDILQEMPNLMFLKMVRNETKIKRCHLNGFQTAFECLSPRTLHHNHTDGKKAAFESGFRNFWSE